MSNKISGIYQIRNKINGKVYIGKSVNIHIRILRHKSNANKGIHTNRYLQNSFNKYGMENFAFEILEQADVAMLPILEQKWIDATCPKSLYNHCKFVLRNENIGRKHADDVRRIMSLKKQGIYDGENNPNYGKKQPLEVRLKMIKNNSGTKLTFDQVKEIREMLSQGMKHADIALKFGISRTVITRINSGARWKITREL
jgi:group I intron endonuclease